MKSVYTLGALLLSLVAMNAQAEWSKSYAIEYTLGDGDSRISARQAAIEEIRTKASHEAGTYVEGTTTLHASGEVTEQVRVLSASMVKITQVNDSMAVNNAGKIVLNISAIASLDDKDLAKRIEAMRVDRNKDLQLKQLAAENEVLIKELHHIRKEINSKVEPSKLEGLFARRDSAIRKLSDNNQKIGLVFEAGTLSRMAESYTEPPLEENLQEFTREFYDYLTRSNVFVEILSVKPLRRVRGNPKDYALATVHVRWDLDEDYVYQLLGKYLQIHRYDGKLYLLDTDNDSTKNMLRRKLFRILNANYVDAKVSLGTQTLYLRMWGDCKMESTSNKKRRYEREVCLQAKMDRNIEFWLTRSETDQATQLNAQVEHTAVNF